MPQTLVDNKKLRSVEEVVFDICPGCMALRSKPQCSNSTKSLTNNKYGQGQNTRQALHTSR